MLVVVIVWRRLLLLVTLAIMVLAISSNRSRIVPFHAVTWEYMSKKVPLAFVPLSGDPLNLGHRRNLLQLRSVYSRQRHPCQRALGGTV